MQHSARLPKGIRRWGKGVGVDDLPPFRPMLFQERLQIRIMPNFFLLRGGHRVVKGRMLHHQEADAVLLNPILEAGASNIICTACGNVRDKGSADKAETSSMRLQEQ